MENTKPGLSDYLEFNKYRAINLMHIGRMAAKHGPFDLLRDMKRYPWIWDLLQVNSLLRRLVKGRSGNYRTAVAMVLGGVVDGVIELVEGIFYRSDRLILHEDLLPPEIFRAMGLQPWVPELLGILLPLIVPDSMQKYLDAAENEGIPPDICSLPRATIGMAMKNVFPPALAVVSSNMPCDGGMSAYTVIAQQMNKPAYWVDVPFDFKSERALDYFANELKAMIAWLEKNTPGRMDWDRLKEICEKRNTMAELELDIWDMIRHRPAPMAAEAIWMSHLWFFNVNPGYDASIKLLADLKSLTEKNLAAGVSAVPREKYRALLWNPPTLHYVDLMVWAEKTYGVSLILDSMSFNRQPFIDTSSPDSILKSLGSIIMQGPMARHTRGPAEANYFPDIFHMIKHFDLDMVWVAGHIGCKNTQAMSGILREKCRDAGVPLLVIDYDLMDSRITPKEGIQAQVSNFMENIMKARRLDQ